VLETDRRRLSSRSQNGWPDPDCWLRHRYDRNRLHGRPEGVHCHGPGFWTAFGEE